LYCPTADLAAWCSIFFCHFGIHKAAEYHRTSGCKGSTLALLEGAVKFPRLQDIALYKKQLLTAEDSPYIFFCHVKPPNQQEKLPSLTPSNFDFCWAFFQKPVKNSSRPTLPCNQQTHDQPFLTHAKKLIFCAFMIFCPNIGKKTKPGLGLRQCFPPFPVIKNQ
jgi:hypothetical protein